MNSCLAAPATNVRKVEIYQELIDEVRVRMKQWNSFTGPRPPHGNFFVCLECEKALHKTDVAVIVRHVSDMRIIAAFCSEACQQQHRLQSCVARKRSRRCADASFVP